MPVREIWFFAGVVAIRPSIAVPAHGSLSFMASASSLSSSSLPARGRLPLIPAKPSFTFLD